jgi:hypothetical protein
LMPLDRAAAQPDAGAMRALLLLIAACGVPEPPALPDGAQPSPDAPLVQFVEDGSYELAWASTEPAEFATCAELHVLAVGELLVEFSGSECGLSFDVQWRGNCVCTNDWCFCPNVRSLYAEIGGVPVRAYRR